MSTINENDPLELIKKQLAAMGLDPNQVMQYMNNAAALHADPAAGATGGNPMQTIMNIYGGKVSENDMLGLFDNSPELKEDTDLSAQELKAVLCGTNVAYNNVQFINALETDLDPDFILGGLESAWEVNNREELISTIDWLENGGHKIYFDLIWAKLRALPTEEWLATINVLEQEAAAIESMEAERIEGYVTNLANGFPLLKAQGCFTAKKDINISAWDLERAINLCRYGYDVNYLSREEALERIKRHATKMYKIYDSWKSLSEAYLLGFTMWNGDPAGIEERIEDHNLLLTHEKSLWNKIAW